MAEYVQVPLCFRHGLWSTLLLFHEDKGSRSSRRVRKVSCSDSLLSSHLVQMAFVFTTVLASTLLANCGVTIMLSPQNWIQLELLWCSIASSLSITFSHLCSLKADKKINQELSACETDFSSSSSILIFKGVQEVFKRRKNPCWCGILRSLEVWDHVPWSPTVIKKSSNRFSSYFMLYMEGWGFVQWMYSWYMQGILTLLCRFAEMLLTACLSLRKWEGKWEIVAL